QITGRAAAFTGIAPPAHAELHAVLHTGGEIQCDQLFAVHPSVAFTSAAFGRDRISFAITVRTGGHRLHLPEEGIGNPAYLPRAAAGAAALYRPLILRPAAAPLLPGDVLFLLYFFVGALGNIGIAYLELYPKVGAPAALPAASLAPAAQET